MCAVMEAPALRNLHAEAFRCLAFMGVGFLLGLFIGPHITSIASIPFESARRTTATEQNSLEARSPPSERNLAPHAVRKEALETFIKKSEECVASLQSESPFVESFDNLLHEHGHHQECASATWKNLIVMVGGLNYTSENPL